MRINQTQIPGLYLVRQDPIRTGCGWFREGWHEAKLAQAGMGPFRPVQHNVDHVVARGVTRGFHAEPWDRLVSVLTGRAFGAWVDLRPGASFGRVVTSELDVATSAFVPAGVANAHQVLEQNTTFSYLLAEHWTAEAKQHSSFVNLFDPALSVPWPLRSDEAVVSEVDRGHPLLADLAQQRGRPLRAVDSAAHPMDPYQVMFVCTANICRSAYADIVANASGVAGVQFTSAGIRALVGQPIEELMGQQVRGRGSLSDHRARQLTRPLMEEADLVLAMTSRHRRWILDEWPELAPRTFIIGQAARGMATAPDGCTLDELAGYMWRRRDSDPADEVADPYGRGLQAAVTAAAEIDRHLAAITGAFKRLAND